MKMIINVSILTSVLMSLSQAYASFSVTTNGSTVVVSNQTAESTVFDGTLCKADGFSRLKFVSTPGSIIYSPLGIPDYDGGTDILYGQLKVSRGDIFGSGDIVIGAESANNSGLIAQEPNVIFANKIIFGVHGGYLAAYPESASAHLTAVGTSNSYYSIRLGRAVPGGKSSVTLSLDKDRTEALSRLETQGALKLKLDGGCLKVRTHADNPFVKKMFDADGAPDIEVTTSGIEFNVEAPAEMRFGVPLKYGFEEQYEVLSTYAPENASFEKALTVGGWTISANNVEVSNETGEIKSNGSAFDTIGDMKWHTTEGSRYVMLRQGATLSTTVTIPESGFYRVTFLRGCRPPETSAYSKGISTDVMIDGEVKSSFASISGAEDAHAFTRMKSDVFELSQGEHIFALRNSKANANNHFNYDDIRFERISVEKIVGAIRKSGQGAMALESHILDGNEVNVDSGTLIFDRMTLGNVALNVASGAKAAVFASEIASGTVVSVDEGGELAISSDSVNYVKNGGFEADGRRNNLSELTPASWTIGKEIANNETSGLQSDGGTVSANGPHTPNGESSVYLREGHYCSTEVNLPQAGDCRVSLLVACRNYASSHKLRVGIYVDNVMIGEIPARSAAYDYIRHTFTVQDLEAGAHTLKICALPDTNGLPQGSMIFVDDVSMRLIAAPLNIHQGEIRLSSGSKLNLDFDGIVEVAKLFVGEDKINGSRAALVRAGVEVSGSGRIVAGKKAGLLIKIQ